MKAMLLKALVLLAALPPLSPSPAFSQVFLASGQSFSLTFEDLPYVSTFQNDPPPQAAFSLRLTNGDPVFTTNAQWSVELFDPEISTNIPFFTADHALGAAITVPTNAWEQLRGSVTVSVTQGTLSFDTIYVQRIQSDFNCFGASLAASNRSPPQISIDATAGLYISGEIGKQYNIQRSYDFANWSTIESFMLTNNPYYFSDENSSNQLKAFYRAVLTN